MSEFIKRLQDRLKAKNVAKRQTRAELHEQANLSKNLASKQSTFFSLPFLPLIGKRLFSGFAGVSNGQQNTSIPTSLAKGLTYLLMLACALSVTYWLMRIAQVPGTPSGPANGFSKGLTLYSNQDASAAYGLFGNKPLVTENIYLRGVVATSKNSDGTLDGFAIFEIDGKPTNAISVGESIGKGLSLQSIGDESATLLYQGQKLNFKLSKPSKDKNDKSAASPTNKASSDKK